MQTKLHSYFHFDHLNVVNYLHIENFSKQVNIIY